MCKKKEGEWGPIVTIVDSIVVTYCGPNGLTHFIVIGDSLDSGIYGAERVRHR